MKNQVPKLHLLNNHSAVVYWLSLHYNYIHQSFTSGSLQVQIGLVDGTIQQKQFIIIIIIVKDSQKI